jgi:hypothetical protein
VDLSISCLVVALAEFVGVLEIAFMGEALDKQIDGLAKFVFLLLFITQSFFESILTFENNK